MKKYFYGKQLIALIGAVAILLSACGTKRKDEGDTMVVLNQRQIDILSDQGLPTNYDQLTMAQKGAITAIERFLTYLETTHNEEFTFAGYWPTGPEHINAKCSKGVVTVHRIYKDGQYTYWDSYDNLLREKEVHSIIDSYFQEENESGAFKCYSDFYSDVKDNPGNSVVYAKYIAVFSDCDQKMIMEKATSFEQWARGQNLNAQITVLFYGFAEENFANIEDYSIQEIIDSHIETAYAICCLNENGNTAVSGRGA